MQKIFRNMASISAVHISRGKQFAFGILHEPEPRHVFFPHWIIKAFDITEEDQGYDFDCVFIEQPKGKHPMVIAIFDDQVVLKPSQPIGEYTGTPGQADFSAFISTLNKA